MRTIRFLSTGESPAAFNMGFDEAMLGAVASGSSEPCLRLYAWEPRAVSIGYFQGLRDEVDEARCRELGVDVVRRLTGGGAVFHADEITYSLIVPDSDPLAAGSILDTYRTICAGIVEGLAELGLAAEFAPLNDIVVRTADGASKKLSGNAQTRRKGCLLQHGTVLLGLDAAAMFSVLRVPKEKLAGRTDAAARVSSVSDTLGRRVGYDEAAAALEAGFARGLGAVLRDSEPSPAELAEAKKWASERYASEAWTGKR